MSDRWLTQQEKFTILCISIVKKQMDNSRKMSLLVRTLDRDTDKRNTARM